MKITKFVHSCLLFGDQKKVLIDPGNYTYKSKVLKVSNLPTIDYLLITHEHQDHFYLPLIKEIKNAFPHLKIISNTSVVEILKGEGIEASSLGNDEVRLEEVPHEKIFGSVVPPNTLFQVFGKLTHPGDSLHFSLNTPLLALPVQAPWGSLTAAVELAETLKPQIIIPIHDWHWNDEARKMLYKRLEEHFAKQRIKFFGLETGYPIEV